MVRTRAAFKPDYVVFCRNLEDFSAAAKVNDRLG